MKKIFLVLFAIFAIGLSSFGQTKMAVALAYHYPNGCSNKVDLGYHYYYDDTQSAWDLRQKAIKEVKLEYSHAKGANDWASYGDEDYVVIVSGRSTETSGCQRFNYGVGFGTNRNEALTKAIEKLKARNWDAAKNYTIQLDKSF